MQFIESEFEYNRTIAATFTTATGHIMDKNIIAGKLKMVRFV
ncbi:MAG: hypothetical protein Q4B70_02525 [Lachnospiraceae bacterium]|nr:hypothetical protein [Lachnospiraceae bacterium]